MSNFISKLGEFEKLDPEVFGKKATTLSAVSRSIEEVPSGFCISVQAVRNILNQKVADEEAISLEFEFNLLLETSSAHKVILRSSSKHEDKLQAQFAGLFNSEKNIVSYDELITEIVKSSHSASSTELEKYAERAGIDISEPHLGLIVQEEIDCFHTGTAYVSQDRILVELFSEVREAAKFSSKIVESATFRKGDKTASNWELDYWLKKTEDGFLAQNFPNNIRVIEEAANCIVEEYALVEFGFSDQGFHLFQVRPSEELMIEKLSEDLGRKAEATKYFIDKGLFNRTCVILPPGVTNEDVIKQVRSSGLASSSGYTVRFSYRDRLGLPRYFVNSIEEAIEKVVGERAPGWTAIIHPYIHVTSSFELLVDERSALLEHVPGVWESDNRLDPDALYIGEKGVSLWAFRSIRLAKYIEPIRRFFGLSPLVSVETLLSWSKKLESTISSIRTDFHSSLPVNVHFVSDKNDEWIFINIRNGFSLGNKKSHLAKAHIVGSVDDLLSWDNESPILVRVSTARGNEAKLLNLAEAIPGGLDFLYVDFGILSHPAMILREYGHELRPSYMLSEIEGEKYEHINLGKIDIGHDPYMRIMSEPAVFENQSFHVVDDREPICPDHLLLLSKALTPSIADGKDIRSLQVLLTSDPFLNKFKSDYIYFERGRAAFCTSGFTASHAHSHILPAHCFEPDCIRELAIILNASPVYSIDVAYSKALETRGEYLIFGSVKLGYRLVSDPRVTIQEKRFVRNYLKKNLISG